MIPWRQPSVTRDQPVPSLVRSDSQERTNRSPFLRDLHMLSVCFLLVFLAYGATQNLESSLHPNHGLGSISLGVLYLSLTISSLAAPLVVIWLGSKQAIVWGLSGYWAFIAANLYPTWYTMIPASLLLGFTASILWVAEGTYLTCAAKSHAAVCNVSEAAALGSFNGVFWGVYASNQVIGNLLTLVMLSHEKNSDMRPHETSPGTMLLFSVFLGCLSVGTVLAFCLRSHTDLIRLRPVVDSPRPGGPDRDFVRATFTLLYENRMLLFILLLVYTGLQQAFIWGDFTRDIVTPALGISWVGGVMAVYGMAGAVASLLVGRYPTSLTSITTITCTGAFVQLLVIVRLLFKQSYAEEGWEGFVTFFGIAVLWGIGDAAFNTQISSLLGTLYPYDTEAAFAQWKIWQSAATSAAFFASPHSSLTVKLYVLLGVLFTSIASFLVAIFWTKRQGFPPLLE